MTIGELASHNHWIIPNVALWAAASQRNEANQNTAPQVAVGSNGSVGSDGAFFIDRLVSDLRYVNKIGESQAHNNLQPYITCFMWQRTN